MRKHPVVRMALAGAILVLAGTEGGRLSADAVVVRSVPIQLCPDHPEWVGIGRLIYRGGLWLSSDDRRFGGFSSLRILGDAGAWRLVSVSDEGRWLSGRLVHDAAGNLTGLTDTEIGTLQDTEGRPLAAKEAADAESLAVMPDGSFVVGFEHQHRLWRYAGITGRPEGPATPVPAPAELAQAPENGGLEAVVALASGRLLALTEFWIHGDRIRGWFDGPPDWKPIGYRFAGAFRPSDAALLPSGDLLVLERAYNPQRGVVGINFRRVEQSRLKKGATLPSQLVGQLAPPLVLDNFEGLDCRREPGGATVLYVMSDDNFNREQRTLLLKFELKD
jgi:hypothetical protein